MPKHLYTILALTFITGFASGIYVYFTSRQPADTPSTEFAGEQEGYEIVATTYGGCERIGCSSFRVSDDGAYTFLAGDMGGEYERFEDVISDRQLESLTELIDDTPLEKIEMTSFEGTCPAAYDGIAYRFSIRYEDQQYDFDSCVEDTDDVPLFEEIRKYFDIMSMTYRTDSP